MEHEDRLQRAIRLSKMAADKDREGDFQAAFELYKLALDNWHFVCKYQTCLQMKESMYRKMDQYVTRAESIKEFLETQRQESSAGCGANNKAGSAVASEPERGNQTGYPPFVSEEERLKDKLGAAIVAERPNVSWADIAGLESAKEALQEAVILPTRFPNLFTGERKPWKGILLYGPPGTGKTHLAKACASEANATFVSVSSADLISKWQGESEKLVRSLFELARERRPCIIFIDEVDSMCCTRSDSESESSRRIKTELLVQMDGIGKDSSGVLVLGATNVPWELDAAIRRRFERRVYIPLPDRNARRRLFELTIGKTPHMLLAKDMDTLADESDGYSGADIGVIVRDALFQPVRKCSAATHFKKVYKDGVEYLSPCSPTDRDTSRTEIDLMSVPSDRLLPPDVGMDDFAMALENTKPSVGTTDLDRYMTWTANFGLEGG